MQKPRQMAGEPRVTSQWCGRRDGPLHSPALSVSHAWELSHTSSDTAKAF